jgi:hypothetical protein
VIVEVVLCLKITTSQHGNLIRHSFVNSKHSRCL